MTALNVIQFPGEIHMFGDTAHYGSNAALTKFKPKIHAVPTAKSVIGFSGRSVLGETVREWVAGARSIEELIGDAEVAVRWMIENTDLGKMVHTILVAGFTGNGEQQLWKMHFSASEAKAPKFVRMKSTEWEFRPSTQFRKVGGEPLSAAEIHSRLHDFCRTVLTAQRNTKRSIEGWNNGIPASVVGGDGILVTVTPDTITQRVLISWPDIAGRSVCLEEQIASIGINSGESSNYDVNSTIGYVGPTTAISTTTLDTPTGSVNSGSYTYFTRTGALPNSSIVTKIGVYSSSAKTFKIKIGKQNTISNYDVVYDQSVAHPGGGWVDFTLTTPFEVPASGTYNIGAYQNGTNDMTGTTVPVSALAGDQGVANNVTMTIVSSNNMFGLRYVYVTGYNDMTLTTIYEETDLDEEVSKARVLLEYDASDNPELNVDLIAEVTCDGGAHWAAGTLELFSKRIGNGGDRHHGAETELVSCTPGTSVAARIKVLNGKDVKIHGLSLDWK